jgi:thiol:disulfide interchange protein DsbA
VLRNALAVLGVSAPDSHDREAGPPEASMKPQRGGFVMGLVVGLLIGLAVALGVALYITKAPMPFINKVPQRTAEQDRAEGPSWAATSNWDPNAPLAGKPGATPVELVPPGALHTGDTLSPKRTLHMQRREFSKQLAGAGLGLAVAGAAQAQGGPVEGTHYVKLSTPLAVSLPADKKIEVVEFFSYGCPHCYNLEPLLEPWVRKLPADVSFRQVPVGFSFQFQVMQKTYYALEEMGQLANMHRKVFSAIHAQGKRLSSEGDVVAFMQAAGAHDGVQLGQSGR